MRLPQRIQPATRAIPGRSQPTAQVLPAGAATITYQNNADIPTIATLRWGGIDVGNCGATPGKSCGIGSELVWYDVYAKRVDTNELVASKTGVYGNSSVVLVKDGAGYRLV